MNSSLITGTALNLKTTEFRKVQKQNDYLKGRAVRFIL